LSIGLGQFCHAIRRNINLLYIIENNGVYGLTKGQFSASADLGSKAKKGEANTQQPIDPVLTALSLGATFVARSFSGDKEQLVPLIQAGFHHKGFALIDVLSPCVTFNDHEGSTKSYSFTREHYHEAVHTDLVAPMKEITAQYAAGDVLPVTMHDGTQIRLRKIDHNYNPIDRPAAYEYIQRKLAEKEFLTGLLYVEPSKTDFHDLNDTPAGPLNQVPYEKLSPGSKGLQKILARYR
jgi:2-oxoglutarate ferredoxin oxidoreductase subunit beta